MGAPSGPGSKKDSDKKKSDRAKSDAYFKDAARRYKLGGGGNKEINDKDRRKKTGGQHDYTETYDLRKQRILESIRRAGLHRYK